MYSLSRLRSESSKSGTKDSFETPKNPKLTRTEFDPAVGKYSSDDDDEDLNDNKRKLELAWLTKALEQHYSFVGGLSSSHFHQTAVPFERHLVRLQLSALGIRRHMSGGREKKLGFDPNTVTAVGIATPPCVSKELAESCCDFVSTVVMQDDIVPRLSFASLARLRNEIIQTD
ncbi:Sn1-specific diacylglycerol lipase beta, partial [Bienertia sinuspersici]